MAAGGGMTVMLQSQRLLFAFFLRDGWRLFREVATVWDRPRRIPQPSGPPIRQFVVRRDVIDDYNRRYDELRHHLRLVVAHRGLFGRAFIAPLLAIRLACVVTAATLGFGATFAVSLLQFVVAPYSFFAAFAAWLGVVPFYVMHFALFGVLQTLTGRVYHYAPALAGYLRVPVTTKLIVGWIIVDQVSCLVLCFRTPRGRPVRYAPRRLLQSIPYGFLNSKTYWLILLLCLRGFQVDLLALAIAAAIPFERVRRAARVLRPILPPLSLHGTFPSAMFYHYHRVVHLPGPYLQAHHHHHYLLDSTPFDADQHGSGAPEEWLKLMTELSVCLLTGLMPWSFTLPTLLQSLDNRIGHTRLEGEHPHMDNFHVNHHARHVKNFGFARMPLDLLMGTEVGDVSRLGNDPGADVRCTRHVTSDHYVLEVVPVAPHGTAGGALGATAVTPGAG